MTITDRDIRDQVQQATEASEGSYDADAIVREIVQRYGLVSIDTIDHDEFWAIVGQYPTDPEAIARMDKLQFKRQTTTLPGESFTTWRGDEIQDVLS